jgi:hypothetical protein
MRKMEFSTPRTMKGVSHNFSSLFLLIWIGVYLDYSTPPVVLSGHYLFYPAISTKGQPSLLCVIIPIRPDRSVLPVTLLWFLKIYLPWYPSYIPFLYSHSNHFGPEDAGRMFLWNTDIHLQDYMDGVTTQKTKIWKKFIVHLLGISLKFCFDDDDDSNNSGTLTGEVLKWVAQMCWNYVWQTCDME